MKALGRGQIKRAVLTALEQRPLWTAREMAAVTGLTSGQVRRALRGLRRIGVVCSGWTLSAHLGLSDLQSPRGHG